MPRKKPNKTEMVDVSEYLAGANDGPTSEPKEYLTGLNNKSFTIVGTWDPRPQCGVCGERFTYDLDSGVPVITEVYSGLRVVACPPCAVALMTPDSD